MKVHFEKIRRYGLILCVLALAWSVWASQTNLPPVRIVQPPDNTLFKEGTNVVLLAEVEAASNTVVRLEFLENGKTLAVLSNAPYRHVWTGLAGGAHKVEARAVFADGSVATSEILRIRAHNTLLTFWLDRIPWLQVPWFNVPVWQYCATLIYIFLAFYISKFLDFAIRVWLKRLTEKTETQFDDLLLELLHGPVKFIAFVVFLSVGLEIFPWPVWLENILEKGFKIIVAVTITYTALKAVDMLMGYWKQRSAADDKTLDTQLFPIVRKTLKVFVVVVSVLVTSQNLGLNITAVITSLSIGGLAVGLAAQDTLANFFGAVAVFVDKPFRVGDRIRLDNVDGVVENIGFRSTRIRNLDGHLVTVPNKTMGNATITNISLRPNIKTTFNIGITYNTPPARVERALEILREIYRSHPQTGDVWLSFDKFADCSLNLLVIHWWAGTDYKLYLEGMKEINLAIKQRFDAEGIEFAFPTQTVYVKNDGTPPKTG